MKPIQDQEKHYRNYQLNDDFYLKLHYNGIVVLFLNQKSKVKKIEFSQKIVEQLKNVVGRGKNNAVEMHQGQKIATITYEDGTQRDIQAPLKTFLFEFNISQEETLVKDNCLAIFGPPHKPLQIVRAVIYNNDLQDYDKLFQAMYM